MAKKLKGKELEAFKNRVTIRPFKPSDAKACNDLFNLVFKQNRTMDQWKWLYNDRPRGGANIFVADLDGEVIGQYPLVYTQYKIGDQYVLAGDHIDAAMKEECRGTGIYSKMGNEHHAYFPFNMGLGFPSAHYYRFGSKTIGYVSVTKVPFWLRILRPEMVLEHLSPIPILGKLVGQGLGIPLNFIFRPKENRKYNKFSFEQIQAFDERVDMLWDKVKDDRHIMAVRDQAFLNWRFQKSPLSNYDIFYLIRKGEVVGYVVGLIKDSRGGKRGILVDMLTISDPAIEKAALAYAMDYFTGMGADYVTCLMLDKYYSTHLLNQGFHSFPFSCLLVYKNFTVNSQELSNPNAWYISSADTDWI